jgi:hypothetical protein
MAGCALAVLVACGELKKADETPPTTTPTTNPPQTGGGAAHGADTDGGSKPKDDAAVVTPVLCTDCPVETVLNQAGSFGPIVIDDANVYISEIGKHTYRCAKTGCDAPTTLLSDGPTRMALAGGKLWIPDHQSLTACATTGCAGVASLVLTEPGLLGDIATDGTRVVWQYAAAETDVFRSCPIANCTKDTAFTITNNAHRRILTAGNGFVVWISATSEVLSCKDDELCAGGKHLGSLALTDITVNADTAFWVSEASEISKCPLAGCDEHATVITKADSARATAADATHVYWRSTTDNAIERCPISDCAKPETIATGVATATYQNLALDDHYVYWATRDGVFRRQK